MRATVSLIAILAAGVALPAFGAEMPELEVIIVTAQKRSETLQSVPMSIKALGDAELRKSGAQSFSDILVRVPALSFRSAGPGRQKLTLRGISAASGAPTVGYYIDETPISSSSSASGSSFQQSGLDPNLFDVERVEVLRGPQGTLYGTSSMGGSIKVVPKQPDAREFQGSVNAQASVTQHGGFNWVGNAAINIPIVQDRIALRVAGTYINNDGFVDRLVGDFDFDGSISEEGVVSLPSREPNPAVPVKRIKDVNTETVRSLRAALKIDITDNVYIQPSVFFQRTTQDGKPVYESNPGKLDQRRRFDIKEPFEDEFALFNIKTNVETDGVSFLSSTSYLDRKLKSMEDFTDLMSHFFGYSSDPADLPSQRFITTTGALWDLTTPPFPGTVEPFPASASEQTHNKDFTQEFRLTSNSESKLKWILGAYYKHVTADQSYNFLVPGYREAFPAYDIILGNVFGNTFATTFGSTTFEEFAVFGEATYSITSRLRLIAGARWFKYSNDLDRTSQGLFFGAPVPQSVSARGKDNGINPKLLIAYDVANHAQIYATAAKGSRPGGGNPAIPANRCEADLAALGRTSAPESYGSDQLWSYELGTKSRLIDGRATLNAAVYQIDWSNVQQRILLPLCGGTYVDNAGKARSRGVEIEFDALLTEALRVSGGVGYNEAKFIDGTLFSGITKGERLLDAPKWTINFTGEYSFKPTDEIDSYLRASWNHVSASLDLENIEKKAYSVVDIRAGMSSGPWEASLFVSNVFDVQAELTKVDTIGAIIPEFFRISTNRPRTLGLSITHSFN